MLRWTKIVLAADITQQAHDHKLLGTLRPHDAELEQTLLVESFETCIRVQGLTTEEEE